MPIFDAGELEVWTPDQFPPDHPGARGICRFAPDCATARRGGPSHPGCPDSPAEFSERLGGDELGGYKRYMPLCRPRAEARFGRGACVDTEAVGSA